MSIGSRASLAGAFCCNWYPQCHTKTGISILSFRSAEKYVSHMLTHMDADIVFEIADICREAAPERPRLSIRAKSATVAKSTRATLTKKNLATLATQYEDEGEEEEDEVLQPPPKKNIVKKSTKKAVSAPKPAPKSKAKPAPVQEEEMVECEDNGDEDPYADEGEEDQIEEAEEEDEVKQLTKKFNKRL